MTLFGARTQHKKRDLKEEEEERRGNAEISIAERAGIMSGIPAPGRPNAM